MLSDQSNSLYFYLDKVLFNNEHTVDLTIIFLYW